MKIGVHLGVLAHVVAIRRTPDERRTASGRRYVVGFQQFSRGQRQRGRQVAAASCQRCLTNGRHGAPQPALLCPGGETDG